MRDLGQMPAHADRCLGRKPNEIGVWVKCWGWGGVVVTKERVSHA